MRISVIGTSGSGKSTVAALVSRRLGVPHIELDALRHGPGWVETPDDELRRQVAVLAAGDAWVIDGNYAAVREVVWPRATHVVWLDLPLPLVMAQVIWRSVERAVTGRELWNGNREDWRRWASKEHPIRWALSTHGRRRRKFEAEARDATNWVRLRSRREIRRWIESLPRGGRPVTR